MHQIKYTVEKYLIQMTMINDSSIDVEDISEKKVLFEDCFYVVFDAGPIFKQQMGLN